MISKTILPALLLALLTNASRAENPTFSLTPDNLAKQRIAIEILAGPREQQSTPAVQYTIKIKAKSADAPLAPTHGASLIIYSGDDYVGAVALQPRQEEGELSYLFTLAEKSLARSVFVHSEIFGEFSSNHYSFRLQDFRPAK